MVKLDSMSNNDMWCVPVVWVKDFSVGYNDVNDVTGVYTVVICYAFISYPNIILSKSYIESGIPVPTFIWQPWKNLALIKFASKHFHMQHDANYSRLICQL